MATKSIIVKDGQSVTDLAIQYYGSYALGMPDICSLNNIGPTDKLVPGTELLVTETSNETVKYLDKYVVATSGVPGLYTGIGYMVIEEDFIVE